MTGQISRNPNTSGAPDAKTGVGVTYSRGDGQSGPFTINGFVAGVRCCHCRSSSLAACASRGVPRMNLLDFRSRVQGSASQSGQIKVGDLLHYVDNTSGMIYGIALLIQYHIHVQTDG